eukprot:323840-Amphidinium_carterae.1
MFLAFSICQLANLHGILCIAIANFVSSSSELMPSCACKDMTTAFTAFFQEIQGYAQLEPQAEDNCFSLHQCCITLLDRQNDVIMSCFILACFVTGQLASWLGHAGAWARHSEQVLRGKILLHKWIAAASFLPPGWHGITKQLAKGSTATAAAAAASSSSSSSSTSSSKGKKDANQHNIAKFKLPESWSLALPPQS